MWFTYIIKILFGNITTKDPIRVFKWTSFKHSACEFEFWAAAKLNNTFDHKIPSKNVLLLPINCDRFDKFGDTTIDWATESTDSSVARKWNSDQCTNLSNLIQNRILDFGSFKFTHLDIFHKTADRASFSPPRTFRNLQISFKCFKSGKEKWL